MSSTNDIADRLSALHELLEDTVELAAEEEQISSANVFVNFVTSCIPMEILAELREITGGDDEEDTGEDDYLTNVWEERYSTHTDDDYENNDSTAPRECLTCSRVVRSLTRHHVYPKETHKKCLARGYVSEADKHLLKMTIAICRLCHSTIHKFFTNEELASRYNTVDALMEDERFERFVEWNSKQSGLRNGRVR